MVKHVVQPVHAAEHLQGAQLVHGNSYRTASAKSISWSTPPVQAVQGVEVADHLPARRIMRGRQSELPGPASLAELLATGGRSQVEVQEGG